MKVMNIFYVQNCEFRFLTKVMQCFHLITKRYTINQMCILLRLGFLSHSSDCWKEKRGDIKRYQKIPKVGSTFFLRSKKSRHLFGFHESVKMEAFFVSSIPTKPCTWEQKQFLFEALRES